MQFQNPQHVIGEYYNIEKLISNSHLYNVSEKDFIAEMLSLFNKFKKK